MIKLIKNNVKKVSEAYNTDLVKIANSTSRSKGASAINPDGTPRAVVVRYIMETSSQKESILDFGAGREAVQTQFLRDKGFNVIAYDFGDNIKDLHDPDALAKTYDTVFASNVLNVSSDTPMLIDTLTDIWKAVKPGGRAVFNYPSSPRKAGLKTEEVAKFVEDTFGIAPVRVGGNSNAPIWEVKK